MAQLFNTPGDSLINPLEASHFGDIKKAVDKATTDLIIRPDWEANLEVCDLVVEMPQFGVKQSINVSVCAGVYLWQAALHMRHA